jgi:hypothetical protein
MELHRMGSKMDGFEAWLTEGFEAGLCDGFEVVGFEVESRPRVSGVAWQCLLVRKQVVSN